MDFFSDDMRRDPFPLYAQIRGTTPVLKIPSTEIWMLFDYEGVKRALTEPETFSSDMTTAGRTNPQFFIFFDGMKHAKLRGLVLRAFTPRVMAGLEPRIRELSRELLDAVIERGEFDLVADFAVPLPTRVITEMLGLPASDLPIFKRWTDVLLGLAQSVSGEESEQYVAAYRAATGEMFNYLLRECEARRVRPREDLLTRLVEAEVDGERLSPGDLLGFFQLLLVAGSETTTNLISSTMLCLLENPEQLARLRGEPGLLPQALEEVLRFRSPVQAVFRATRREVEIHGVTIPAGRLVLPVIGSANRDPSQFVDPDRFDIGREANGHIAFGHGVHFCIGAALSRLEGRIAVGDLLARCAGLARASDVPWTPREAFHVHGPASLPMTFTPGHSGG